MWLIICFTEQLPYKTENAVTLYVSVYGGYQVYRFGMSAKQLRLFVRISDRTVSDEVGKYPTVYVIFKSSLHQHVVYTLLHNTFAQTERQKMTQLFPCWFSGCALG